MKKAKKMLNVVLAIMMVFSTMFFNSISINAAGFTKRTSAPPSGSAYWYSSNNPFWSGGYVGQCTWYAYGRAYEILGSKPNLSVHGSGQWYSENISKGAYSYGSTPKLGAIACWSNHVAVVEEIDSNGIGITVSQYYGSTDQQFHYVHYNSGSAYTYGGNVFQGYIYIINSDPVPPTPTITPTQCVSDGDYHIVSALNESYGLNIAKNSTAAKANVQLWNNMDTANLTSLVTVKHTGSGYYTLTFRNSGKNLDVCNADKTSGTNVWQYDSNESDAQKWIIVPSGDCYFYIVPKINTGLALDVYGGTASGGTNIQIYTQNQSKAQKWKFLASGKPTEASVTNSLKDGEYTISTALNSYSGINIYGGKTENGVNVQLWNNMGLNTTNTNVKVKHLGDGIFSLIFKKSNKAIESVYRNISGANVQQNNFTNSNNQKWIIKPAGNGYYYIINRLSGLAMDVYDGSTSNGTNIHAFLLNWSNAQKWKFNPVKYRITYDVNGGKLYNDNVTNHKVDGLNTSRLDSQVIVYTRIFGAKTTTNQYGDEYSFDINGKKVGSRLYNNTTGLDIPAGGFVISKHANSSFDLHNVGEKAAYAYPDFGTGYVSFYNNQHDYEAGAKLVTLNNTYGTLATPTRDGYTFDGWYTDKTGGTKISSSSTFTGTTTLYAHWSENPESTNPPTESSTEPSTAQETTISPTTQQDTTSETTETQEDTTQPEYSETTEAPEDTTRPEYSETTEAPEDTTQPEYSETTEAQEYTTQSENNETTEAFENTTSNTEETTIAENTTVSSLSQTIKYLPSKEQIAEGGTFKLVIEDTSGEYYSYNLIASPMVYDGVPLYTVTIPEGVYPKGVQIQNYYGDNWKSQVVLSAEQFEVLKDRIIAFDGSAYDENNVTESSFSTVETIDSTKTSTLPDTSTTSVEDTDSLIVTSKLITGILAVKPAQKPALKKNTAKISAKTKTVKAYKLKKKAMTVKAIIVKNAKGKVSYEVVKKDKKNVLTLKKNGKIRIKKGSKKGTYKLSVLVAVSGNSAYKKASKIVKTKIKIK